MFNKPLIIHLNVLKCSKMITIFTEKQRLFNNYEVQTLNSKLINFIRNNRQEWLHNI